MRFALEGDELSICPVLLVLVVLAVVYPPLYRAARVVFSEELEVSQDVEG